MNIKSTGRRFSTYLATTAVLLLAIPNMAFAQPAFSKEFIPGAIGPGSTSQLVFTIANADLVNPVDDLAFSDTLPAGVTIATPASASTDCNGLATLSAPDGGSTISLTDAQLGVALPAPAGDTICTVSVNVTSSTVGTHSNVSGDLTSDAGNSGTASDDLIVDEELPGFIKSFSPGSIPLGGTSILTLTLDNSHFGSIDQVTGTVVLQDKLPAGMKIAAPANASTDCGLSAFSATLTAVSGTDLIRLTATGFLPTFPVLSAGSICTVTVDVTTESTGVFVNTTSDLLIDGGPRGFATAALDVPVEFLVKNFTDDPVAPGESVNLQFTVTNLDRDFSATDIAFDDNLGSVVAGLAPDAVLPANPCGAGSTLSFLSPTLSLTGGTLASGDDCTFDVSLLVPVATAAGNYTNTTDAVTATIDGTAFTGNTASDDLVVNFAPILTKEFTDDPVGAGDTVTLKFTIENTNTDLETVLREIAFEDVLPSILKTASVVPGAGFCNGTGTAVFTPFLFIPGDNVPARIFISDAELGPGESCSFEFVLDVVLDATTGTYTNTTGDIFGVLDDCGECSEPVSGIGASDDLVIVGAPRLKKTFTDDPVEPGGTVTLEFELSHEPLAPADATGITFTDDLEAALSGLVATLPPIPDPPCGAGSTLTGTSLLTFTGGTLAPGETCTFSVTLNVPGDAPAGSHTNTTSSVEATIDGIATIGNPAVDDLRIAGLVITKLFVDDPVQPGADVTLRFTIENTSPLEDATSITFRDDLNVPGLVSKAPLPDPDPDCGAGSTLTTFNPPGPTVEGLAFDGGSLLAGTSCTFDVVLTVAAGTASNTYNNTTYNFFGIFDVDFLAFDNASDQLTVTDRLLFLTKEFTDDPTIPGGTVNLEFVLTNLDAANAASDLEFSDDLDAVLTGLTAVGLPMGVCGGTLSTPDAGMTVEFSGGSLAAASDCSFSVTVQLPAVVAPGSYTNTTSAPKGTINALPVTGDPAIDDLVVNSITLSKSFDGPTTTSGTPQLTFNLNNESATMAAADLNFNDDLEATLSGLTANPLTIPASPCGAGSTLAASVGNSLLTFAGGNLPAGGSCSFVVDLLVPAAAALGDFPNTTSPLSQIGLVVGAPATADLTVEGTVSGVVNGLAGSGLVLQNNGGDDILIPLAGPFAFTFPPQANGSPYAVTVDTDPTGLSQTCTVANGNGNLAGVDVTNVVVDCVTDSFTVSGVVNGLAGSGLVLQNNGGDDIPIPLAGPFAFTFPAQVDGSGYAVTVDTHPTGLNQTCTVANGNGTLAGADVINVVVTCATETFTVGGNVNGLAGSGLVLRNNGGDDILIPLAGPFAFTFSAHADGAPYAVTVNTQPTGLSQTCTVSNDSGTLAGADVTDVTVNCVTDTFTVGGTVSGLTGSGLVLQNTGGDDILVPPAGPFAFTFPAQVDGSAYSVTVLTQPTGPSQACTVTDGGGTLAGTDITDVTVTCANNEFTIGGTVGGLPESAVAAQESAQAYAGSSMLEAAEAGPTLVLQNNGGDDLTIMVNGDFTFATPLPDGASYDVTVKSVTEAVIRVHSCTVSNGSGIVSSSNVVNVLVACTAVDIVTPIPALDKFGLLLLMLAMIGILVWRQTRIAGGRINERTA